LPQETYDSQPEHSTYLPEITTRALAKVSTKASDRPKYINAALLEQHYEVSPRPVPLCSALSWPSDCLVYVWTGEERAPRLDVIIEGSRRDRLGRADPVDRSTG
jgi:hypothetical protein